MRINVISGKIFLSAGLGKERACMKSKGFVLFGLIVLFICRESFCETQIPLLKKVPVIDGMIGQDEWNGAIKFIRKPEEHKLTMYIGWAGDVFYVGCDCRDSEPKRIRSIVRERDGKGIWSDDCIEVFIDTDNDKKTYYHFIINACGSLYDEFCRDVEWNAKLMKYSVKRTVRGWSCEVSIPLGTFNRSDVCGRWGINIMRHFQNGYQVLSGKAHNPKSWQMFDVPRAVAERILNPVTERKFKEIANRFSVLRREGKQSGFYSDIYPFVVSIEMQVEEIGSKINTNYSRQKLLEDINHLSKNVRQLELIIRRAEGFARIANKTGEKMPEMMAFAVSPMLKVRKNFLLPENFVREVDISAAKGESESAQIVLATWNKCVRTIRVKITDLVHQEDKIAKIARSNIHIYKVCYVYAYQTCRPEFPSGLWPDPLVKFEAFDVPAYDYQPIWITVDVPRRAQSGIYEGKITIASVKGKEIKIPVRLKVRDFSLPITPALKTSFSIWAKTIAYQLRIDLTNPENAKFIDNLIYKYYWPEAIRHRITLRNIPVYGPKFNKFVSEIMKQGATTIALPLWQTLGASAQSKANIQRLLVRYNWINRAFLYIWDEPSENDYPEIIKRAQRIKSYAPKIKLLCTTRYDESLAPYIDIWVPRFSWFNKNPEPYRKAVKRGDELWLYTCAYPQRPYPNLFLELPGIEPRICILMCWRYGARGFLYYSANYWKSNDIWCDVRGYPEANLDGVLFYPARNGEPVLSIRLEILRDGIDDFDYLAILKNLTEKIRGYRDDENARQLISRADELLSMKGIIKSFTEWTKDIEAFEDYRDKVAKLIEVMQRYSESKK